MEHTLMGDTHAALEQLSRQRALDLLDRATDLTHWATVMGQAIEAALVSLTNKSHLIQALEGLRKEQKQQQSERIRRMDNAADRAELYQRLGRPGPFQR
jgi:hypothetical protein